MRFSLAKAGVLTATEFDNYPISEVLASYSYYVQDAEAESNSKVEFYTSLSKAIGANVANSVAKLMKK